jgi:hypothetical protein
VHDARRRGSAQLLTKRDRLRASERAEGEAVEVAIKHPLRVFDLGVPDQIETSQVL